MVTIGVVTLEGFNSGRIIDRQSVTEALQTGLIAIDSSIPIGCGQRENCWWSSDR